MWVKICANTNLEDARLATEFGADAVGFVFAPSKRQVTAGQVGAITRQLPESVEKAGVFHATDVGEISGIAIEAGLTMIQLHGGVNEALAARLHDRFGDRMAIVQTVHWASSEEDAIDASAAAVLRHLESIAAWGTVYRVLIDSKVGAATGGTGVSFDWAKAREVFASAPKQLRLIAAGGLTPENVAQAVEQMKPWGVDVASGVEAVPGRKELSRLKEFLRVARAANIAYPASRP